MAPVRVQRPQRSISTTCSNRRHRHRAVPVDGWRARWTRRTDGAPRVVREASCARGGRPCGRRPACSGRQLPYDMRRRPPLRRSRSCRYGSIVGRAISPAALGRYDCRHAQARQSALPPTGGRSQNDSVTAVASAPARALLPHCSCALRVARCNSA